MGWRRGKSLSTDGTETKIRPNLYLSLMKRTREVDVRAIEWMSTGLMAFPPGFGSVAIVS